MNDDFRDMKIHMFALRLRNEIKRSSQAVSRLPFIEGMYVLGNVNAK